MMRPYLQRLASLRDTFKRTERVSIAIAQCIHITGFRYGTGAYHPYETYVCGLHQGRDLAALREQFIMFLRNYRPSNVHEALGITLERSYPLWSLPWRSAIAARLSAGAWLRDPEESPDLLTHFSDRGIPVYRITEECFWLERAYYRIASRGYLPEVHGNYIKTQQLLARTGDTRYLVHDGNHRVSALAALGETHVLAELRTADTVKETSMRTWPMVRNGCYTPSDALAVFSAYFSTNTIYSMTDRSADVLIK